MIDKALEISSPIGLMAAGGVMPFAIADSLTGRGINPVLFALRGACDPVRVERVRHHWISIGQLGKATKLFRAENCRDLVFIGTLVRPALSEIRLDRGTLRVLGRVWAAFRGGDDHLLSGIAGIFERDGFRMVGIKDVAPDLVMPQGCLTRASADDQAIADIAKGRDLLRALSPFDIGQAAVVIGGHRVMRRIFLVATEESGDRLGAALMKVLRQRLGDAVRFDGVGGRAMASQGLASRFPIEELSIMGFSAVLRRLPTILRHIRETAD